MEDVEQTKCFDGWQEKIDGHLDRQTNEQTDK